MIAFVGGGGSSIIAQSLTVPIDVISQHMQLIGQRGACKPTHKLSTTSTLNSPINCSKGIERIHVPQSLSNASTMRIVKYLSNTIYRNEGFKGFYRGYFLSTFQVSLNSSLWWPFYYFFQSNLLLDLASACWDSIDILRFVAQTEFFKRSLLYFACVFYPKKLRVDFVQFRIEILVFRPKFSYLFEKRKFGH